MVMFAAASISASESRKGPPSRVAKALPTAVLPAPIMPTTVTGFFNTCFNLHLRTAAVCRPECECDHMA